MTLKLVIDYNMTADKWDPTHEDDNDNDNGNDSV